MIILLIIFYILFIEEIIIEFNNMLNELTKNKNKILIIIINIIIILSAIYLSNINKYDIDRNGQVDYNDVIILRYKVDQTEGGE